MTDHARAESNEPEVGMFIDRLSSARMSSGFAAAAALVISLSGSHAASGRTVQSTVDEAAQRLERSDCDFETGAAQQFIVPRREAQPREMIICNAEGGRDLSGIARALSAGIDDGADDSAFYPDSRMPELLTLRLSRARTQADPSLTELARTQQLASINVAIAKLEAELSRSGAGR